MKHPLQIAAIAGILFASCTHKQPVIVPPTASASAPVAGRVVAYGSLPSLTDSFSRFIPLDSANKMLQSYLSSINSAQNDTELHAIIFKAADLRQMLNNEKMTYVKVMFAHTLDYINAGGAGTYCGYKSKELTVIIAGYDSAGNYFYSPAGKVLDMGAPCPTSCPTIGNATNSLLY